MSSRLRRGLAVAGVVVLLVATLVAPAAGGGGSATISNAIGGSFVRQGTFGLFPATCGEVGVELVPDPLPIPWIWHTAFEFPLATLPAGATIISATLSLRDADGDQPDPINIVGYAGDGMVTAADVQAGTSISYVPTTTGYQSHDVTALIAPPALAAGWAGFLLTAETETFATVHHLFDCPDDAQFPILIITFALPDAAMADTGAVSPLVAIGFGVLLLGVMGALTWGRHGPRKVGT